MYKEIIVLAKSTKHGEYCIAGVDAVTGEWIRPISADYQNEGAVPAIDITYRDGSVVQVLDRVRIKLLSPVPTLAQPENYLYDPTVKWEKTGQSTLEELILFRGYDRPSRIFYNSEKEVSKHELSGQLSLLLVNVQNPQIFIKTFYDGNRRVQLNFEYNNVAYRYFKISDIAVLKAYAGKWDGVYNLKDNLPVVFSLTDEYKKTGKYYKMAAQIFC